MTDSTAQPQKDPLVAVWFALGLILALIVSTAAGLVAWLGGRNIAAAVLTGFGAFGGTATLVVLAINLFRR